jgi:hypothetical protein
VASGQPVLGSPAAQFAAAIERQRACVEEIARIIDLKGAIR